MSNTTATRVVDTDQETLDRIYVEEVKPLLPPDLPTAEDLVKRIAINLATYYGIKLAIYLIVRHLAKKASTTV